MYYTFRAYQYYRIVTVYRPIGPLIISQKGQSALLLEWRPPTNTTDLLGFLVEMSRDTGLWNKVFRK